MSILSPLCLYCLVGLPMFMRNTSKTERQLIIDEFKCSNIPNKMLIVFLMVFILISYPVAKICEFVERILGL